MRRSAGASIALSLLFALMGALWPTGAGARDGGPLPVVVSILPQKFFVEKIGGKLVDVQVMVPKGGTPEQYEPKPRQMEAVAKAEIYFALGVPFESVWLPKLAASAPGMLVVHTEKRIARRDMEAHSHPGEKPGNSHDHAKGEVKDPHLWLSPPLVMLQARSIFEALVAADPKNRPTYEENYKSFLAELADLDISISRLFAAKSDKAFFMVFHPAWGYFADAYGLKQIPVEVEGKEPKAKDLDGFIKLARELGIKTIFVQPQYSPGTAQTIAEAIGGKLVYADDLAADWEKNLLDVAAQIAAASGRR